ncbi:hypothetical protein B296_00037691 [Ensete ventricosum]|uniref:Uncharacterized protein n=1 Tax=Ensete ventricosum TaxID=4639 RepID=A0A426ZM66_ENSVE|nr:hypothetical protein B296_00037691 [Ensete ventricosum]
MKAATTIAVAAKGVAREEDVVARMAGVAKGDVKVATGRGGRKTAAAIVDGWQWRQAVEEGWRRDVGQGLCKGGRGWEAAAITLLCAVTLQQMRQQRRHLGQLMAL